MKDTSKRNVNITLHLTAEEWAIIERLSDTNERKPAELARLLLMRQAVKEWGNQQPKGGEWKRVELD